MGSPAGTTAGAVLTARATRAALGRPWVVALFFLIAGTYAFASMLLGGMLVFARTGASSTTVLVLTAGVPWWNYPAVLVTFPGGSLALPFFPTISMIVVSVGVGIGMSVAAVIASRLIALRRASAGRPLAAGSVAGLTPAILALVTMGACCTTTAASAAGLGVVAQTSGTTVDTLLANDWYLGVFQMVVVGIALLAQEAILVAYGPLMDLPVGPRTEKAVAQLSPLKVRDVALACVRVVMVGAAALWSLWAFAAQFTPAGALSSPSAWFGFIVEHQLLAAVVIAFALYPQAFRRPLLWSGSGRWVQGMQGLLLVLGIWVLTWVPPFWAGDQTAGLVNEVLGIAGLPTAWGAVTPAFSDPLSLSLQLTGGFLLLGSLCLLLSLRPQATVGWFVPPGVDRPEVAPSGLLPIQGRTDALLERASTSAQGPWILSAPDDSGITSVPTHPLTGRDATDPGRRLSEPDGP